MATEVFINKRQLKRIKAHLVYLYFFHAPENGMCTVIQLKKFHYIYISLLST